MIRLAEHRRVSCWLEADSLGVKGSGVKGSSEKIILSSTPCAFQITTVAEVRG